MTRFYVGIRRQDGSFEIGAYWFNSEEGAFDYGMSRSSEFRIIRDGEIIDMYVPQQQA